MSATRSRGPAAGNCWRRHSMKPRALPPGVFNQTGSAPRRPAPNIPGRNDFLSEHFHRLLRMRGNEPIGHPL